MSVSVQGFQSSAYFEQLKQSLSKLSSEEKSALLKKVNGVFELLIKSPQQNVEQIWTLEFKQSGQVILGPSPTKADVVLSLLDDTFVDLAKGKLNGQKAFMGGKLKIKGNMMLSTRLDLVLNLAKNAPAEKVAKTEATEKSKPTGYESSALFDQMNSVLSSLSEADKEKLLSKGKAIYQFDIKNANGQVMTWTLNLKTTPQISTGTLDAKADIIISVADNDFIQLAAGKLNAQKAFTQGKLKVKGNMMLAQKLTAILAELRPKSKL